MACCVPSLWACGGVPCASRRVAADGAERTWRLPSPCSVLSCDAAFPPQDTGVGTTLVETAAMALGVALHIAVLRLEHAVPGVCLH